MTTNIYTLFVVIGNNDANYLLVKGNYSSLDSIDLTVVPGFSDNSLNVEYTDGKLILEQLLNDYGVKLRMPVDEMKELWRLGHDVRAVTVFAD